jgi:transposase
MNKYRFVKSLTTEQVDELTEWVKKKEVNERTRKRIRSILRSHDHYTLDEISELEGVDRDTVSIWFTNWETYGLLGLFDCPKQNRHPILDDAEQEILRQLLSECSYSSIEISRLLEERTGKWLGTESVKRWIKKLGFKWKRTRKSLSSKRNAQEFKQAQQDLKAFLELEKQGQAQVFFFDATGLDLTPCIPYGWYPTGQDPCVSLPASHSKRLNITGFLNRQQELVPFVFEGSCTAAVVKGCFDSFCAQLDSTVPTIVVLDNAPVHTAKLFQEKIPDWQAKNVFPYFLPSYSPELNLIEILWRKIKYSWLPRQAYESFQSLSNVVTQILQQFGDKYQISFA